MKTVPQFELPGAESVFNLASQEAEDGERIARERREQTDRRRAAAAFQSKMQKTFTGCPGFVGGDVPHCESALGQIVIEPNCVDAAMKYLARRFHVGELDVSAGVGLVVEVVARTRKNPDRKAAMARVKPQQYVFEFGSDQK